MQRLNRGWGYKLNYDKEIAVDLAEIAQVERHIPLAATLTEEERARGDYHLAVSWWLYADIPARAQEMAWYEDVVFPSAPDPAPGWYSRGEAHSKRIERDFGGYVLRDPQVFLKKLRTRLARHRRNQLKFG
jgi:hypothetical protein